MRVEVDGADISTAAMHLLDQAAQLRHQLVACNRVPDGLADPALRAGATALSDLAADVVELVAKDLELLATKVRAGVTEYAEVELAIQDRMVGGGTG